MSQRLDRQNERRYILPSKGVKRQRHWSRISLDLAVVISVFIAGFSWGRTQERYSSPPQIPHCASAPEVIVGSGEYSNETGYWSEYACVSEQEFGDNYVNRKLGYDR